MHHTWLLLPFVTFEIEHSTEEVKCQQCTQADRYVVHTERISLAVHSILKLVSIWNLLQCLGLSNLHMILTIKRSMRPAMTRNDLAISPASLDPSAIRLTSPCSTLFRISETCWLRPLRHRGSVMLWVNQQNPVHLMNSLRRRRNQGELDPSRCFSTMDIICLSF
jgi:hypothetical protein